MKHAFASCVAIWLVLFATLRAAESDVRFSQTLDAADRAASGLVRLSSDEVAVIDALVRRDTTARAGAATSEKVAAQFSQRLTADERRTAGLTQLTASELPKFDACVDRFQSAKLARTLLSPPTYLSRTPRVTPTETKRAREVHGSFSLSYGWGSGGYSEKTGSMELHFDDPDRGYSISIGYTESHIKGGRFYRDPFYDPLRSPSEPPPPLRP